MPTDKPSKVGYHFDIIKNGRLDYAPNFGFKEFNSKLNYQHKPQNIYITSNEEIKIGDWVYCNYVIKQIIQVKKFRKSGNDDGVILISDNNFKEVWLEESKKIVLTTDPKLIADGVQAIDDEFLKWLAKNSRWDNVEIKHFGNCCGNQLITQCINCKKYEPIYKTIIPGEEPKQKYKYIGECKGNDDGCFMNSSGHDCGCFVRYPAQSVDEYDQSSLEKYSYELEPKQETLGEAKQRIIEDNLFGLNDGDIFELGVKWKGDRRYSEDEMYQFSQWISHNDWVYLPSKSYWVNEEQEELEQKLSSKEILNLWLNQVKK